MRELVSKLEESTWLQGPEREPQRAIEWWDRRRSKFLGNLIVFVGGEILQVSGYLTGVGPVF